MVACPCAKSAPAVLTLADRPRRPMGTLLPKAAPAVRPVRLKTAATGLARFGALMLRAGDVSVRAREGIERLSATMGLDHAVSTLSFDAIAVTVYEAGQSFTAV